MQTEPQQAAWNGRKDGAWMAAVLAVSAVAVGRLLPVGWVPSDEGTLAASALRVYGGQLPHLDFTDAYTGGLSMLQAAGFRLLGVNLFSLRIVAFAFFLASLPALYYAARRFLRPAWAAVACLTAVGWSYPNYVAAMPSWFNLFFAIFGTAALLRFAEVRTRKWLFVAGVCAGLSVTIKVTGLYFLAAALLFLLFVEQGEEGVGGEASGRSGAYSLACGLCLLGHLALLTRMVWPQLRDGEAVHFLLPSFAFTGLWVAREFRSPHRGSPQRFAALGRLLGPLLTGAAVVAGAFLLPYLRRGGVRAFFRDLASSTAARATGLGGKEHAPGGVFLIYGAVTMALLLAALYWPRMRARAAAGAVALGLAAVLACSAIPHTLQDTWLMAGTLTPMIAVFAVVLVWRGGGRAQGLAAERVLLLAIVASMCSLVQFPFPYVTYFCFLAPLTLLAVLACVAAVERPPQTSPVLGILLVFFLAMGWFGMVGKHIFEPEIDVHALHPLAMRRGGGLRVDASAAPIEDLVPMIQSHAGNGALYAGNDCPELYFLSGLRNPTRDDTGAPAAEVIHALDTGQLDAVVLNEGNFFASSAVPPAVRNEVAKTLPHHAAVGHFTLFWR